MYLPAMVLRSMYVVCCTIISFFIFLYFLPVKNIIMFDKEIKRDSIRAKEHGYSQIK